MLTKKLHILFIACCALFSAVAQTQPDTSKQRQVVKNLFDTDDILDITIEGNTRQLLNNRTGTAKYFSFGLTYTLEDSNKVSIPINIKTRGHFRRLKANCDYPPLLIQFPGGTRYATTFFPSKVKLKLVMPCQGEEYIIREWLVYKIYNLVTDQSFRTRLIRLTMKNEKGSATSPFYGFLIEEEKEMAKRNNTIIVNRKMKPLGTFHETFLKMAVFQYMVGNTDWSVEYLQNIKLIARDSLTVPTTVAYDFDHAGIVGAPYAMPAEALHLSSCKERRYRGFCVQDMASFDSTIAAFNRIKESVYKLYTDCTMLDAKYIKTTVQYLDEFYATINNPKALQKEFSYPCDKNGTGNVIIKGLRED